MDPRLPHNRMNYHSVNGNVYPWEKHGYALPPSSCLSSMYLNLSYALISKILRSIG